MATLQIFVTINKLNGTTEERFIERDISTWNLPYINAPAATTFAECNDLSYRYMFDGGKQVIDGEDVYKESGQSYTNEGYDIFAIWETYTELDIPVPDEETVQLEITPQFYGQDSDISGIGYYDLYINDNNVPYISNVTSSSTVSLHPGDTYTIKTFTQHGYVCVVPQSGTINGTVSDDPTDNIYHYLIFESGIPFGTALNYQNEQVESIENIGYYNLYINNELRYPNQTTPIRVTASAEDTYRIELFAHDGYKVISQSTIEGKCADLNGIDIPLKFVKTVKLVIIVSVDQVMTDTSFSEAVKNYNVKVNGEYYFPEAQTVRKGVILVPGDTYAIEIVTNDGYKMLTDPSTLVGSYSDSNTNGVIYRGPAFEKGKSFSITLDCEGSTVQSIENIGYYNLYINGNLCYSKQKTPLKNVIVYSGDTYKIEVFTNYGYRCTNTSNPVEGSISKKPIECKLLFEKDSSSNTIYIKTENGWKQGIPYVKTANGWKQGQPSTKTEYGWK